MWPFRRLRRQKIVREALLPERAWLEALADHPILRGLRPEEAGRLREFATLFLHEKIFEPARGLQLTEAMKVGIAVQACLPIIHLDFGWYDDWRTVIVYPGEFVRPRRQFDDIGVMHEWEEVVSGESWGLGPVILSWADVEASGQGEGYNVVIHEMAHKLDLRNGAVNGFPPLHRGMDSRAWSMAFTSAFDQLNARLGAGAEVAIDAYAGEEPGEFFAVISEYFFEQPGVVKRAFPSVYEQLRAFYRQDPAARMTRHPEIRSPNT